MLHAVIVEASLLASQGSWHRCSCLPSATEVVGVDRHGKLASARISIKSTPQSAQAVFLGTSLSCGLFSCNSRIQDIDGKSWRALEIVQTMTVGDLRFEVVLDSIVDSDRRESEVDSLW